MTYDNIIDLLYDNDFKDIVKHVAISKEHGSVELGVEIYSAPISMSENIEKVKSIITNDFKVWGNTNTASIHIELKN